MNIIDLKGLEPQNLIFCVQFDSADIDIEFQGLNMNFVIFIVIMTEGIFKKIEHFKV